MPRSMPVAGALAAGPVPSFFIPVPVGPFVDAQRVRHALRRRVSPGDYRDRGRRIWVGMRSHVRPLQAFTGRSGGRSETGSPRNAIVDVAGRKWPGDVGVNQGRCSTKSYRTKPLA